MLVLRPTIGAIFKNMNNDVAFKRERNNLYISLIIMKPIMQDPTQEFVKSLDQITNHCLSLGQYHSIDSTKLFRYLSQNLKKYVLSVNHNSKQLEQQVNPNSQAKSMIMRANGLYNNNGNSPFNQGSEINEFTKMYIQMELNTVKDLVQSKMKGVNELELKFQKIAQTIPGQFQRTKRDLSKFVQEEITRASRGIPQQIDRISVQIHRINDRMQQNYNELDGKMPKNEAISYQIQKIDKRSADNQSNLRDMLFSQSQKINQLFKSQINRLNERINQLQNQKPRSSLRSINTGNHEKMQQQSPRRKEQLKIKYSATSPQFNRQNNMGMMQDQNKKYIQRGLIVEPSENQEKTRNRMKNNEKMQQQLKIKNGSKQQKLQRQGQINIIQNSQNKKLAQRSLTVELSKNLSSVNGYSPAAQWVDESCIQFHKLQFEGACIIAREPAQVFGKKVLISNSSFKIKIKKKAFSIAIGIASQQYRRYENARNLRSVFILFGNGEIYRCGRKQQINYEFKQNSVITVNVYRQHGVIQWRNQVNKQLYQIQDHNIRNRLSNFVPFVFIGGKEGAVEICE